MHIFVTLADNSVRIAINASLSGANKRQAYPIFGQITKNTTIILVHMEKIKGFLFAVRHREILMTDLGLKEINNLWSIPCASSG